MHLIKLELPSKFCYFGLVRSEAQLREDRVALMSPFDISTIAVVYSSLELSYLRHTSIVMPPRYNDLPYRLSVGQAVLEIAITVSHVLVKRYPSCMHCQ